MCRVNYQINGKKVKGIENAKAAFRTDIEAQKSIAMQLVETARFHAIPMTEEVFDNTVDVLSGEVNVVAETEIV